MSEQIEKPAETVSNDSLIFKGYDDVVSLPQEEVARRIALITNSPSENQSVEVNKSYSTDHDELLEPDAGEFKVGDYARATYDDGIDYEAKILHIDEAAGTCLLRYIGYDNEQEVRVCDIIPSWGKKTRRMQYTRAKQAATDGEKSSRAGSIGSEKAKKNKRKRNNQPPTTSTSANCPHFGFGFGAMPPQPPMPPMMVQGQGRDDSDHLSAMLMSWYISGYYTGLYQGMQQQAKSHKPKPKK